MYQALQCDCNIVIPRREVEVDSCFICAFQIHHSLIHVPAHLLNPGFLLSEPETEGGFLSIIGTCDNCYVAFLFFR
jgi:hypothetical protein